MIKSAALLKTNRQLIDFRKKEHRNLETKRKKLEKKNKSQNPKRGGRIFVKFSQAIIEKDSVGNGCSLSIYSMIYVLKMSIDEN